MKRIVNLEVNGEPYEVAAEPGATLLEILRGELGLVGAKKGCDTGGCGCCTVLLDGRAVYSCMALVTTVGGKRITTIEGLARDGKLDPLQQAFVETGAVQCGYCTCGIIMAAKAFLSSHPAPTEPQIRRAIAGNLCRCTGYHKIVEAIRLASSAHFEAPHKD